MAVAARGGNGLVAIEPLRQRNVYPVLGVANPSRDPRDGFPFCGAFIL
jgi:hypothetical protein